MEVYTYLELFVSFTTFALFLLLNSLFNSIRTIYWRTNGVYRQLIANRRAENYVTSAHVKRILFRYTIGRYTRFPENVFVTVHESFVSPSRVLQDDCTLYAITATDAIFIQGRHRPTDVFLHDFFNRRQYYDACKLITIPLLQFNRLAEEIKGDGFRLVFLYNQARCGSTLLTAVFRETGRCLCFHEPTCLSAVCKRIFTDHIWHGATARRVLRNTIRVLCKPYNSIGNRPVAYVIKPIFTDTVTMEMVQEVFPGAVQFFIYRDPVNVAVSFRRIGQVIKLFKLLIYLPNFPNVVATVFELYGIHNTEYRGWTCTIHPEFELGCRISSIGVYYYLQALKHGVDVHGVRYGDLVTHQVQMITNIFHICQFPNSFVKKARSAFGKDSQDNSPISRKNLRAAFPVPPKPPPEFADVARKMSEEFGVPGPDVYQDESFHLPGSIEP